ncbi:MAG: FtsK/SpoIIIE domain-containing protein [bacterium]|nr:FtsK/SpoIIIE domain-containing protein [bacterium]
MLDKATIVEDAAPPYMEWLTKDKASAENELRRQRLREYQAQYIPLKNSELQQLIRQKRKLARYLGRARYDELVTKYRSLSDDLRSLQGRYQEIRHCYENGDRSPGLVQEGRIILRQGKQLKSAYARIKGMLADLRPVYDAYDQARRRIEQHHRSLAYQREEKQRTRQGYREVKTVARLIKATWKITPGCHYIKRINAKRQKNIVARFQKPPKISADAIYLKLKTSSRQIFGYNPSIPYSVLIRNLVDPDVSLKNLTHVVGRPVRVEYGKNQSIWFVVDRLGSLDGLPLVVPFGKFMAEFPFNRRDLIPLPAGVVDGRRVIWTYLEHYPHVLVGGSTRSGKSNLLNAYITTLVGTQSPDDVRLFTFDLKEGVEFQRWKQIPHFAGSVDHIDQVLPALHSIIELMKARYKMFKELGAVKYSEVRRTHTELALPRLVIIMDELGTFVGNKETNEIHTAIRELTAKGAAAGVHVIAATQTPTVEVIPGLIKNNMDSRMAFHCANNTASQVIIDVADAAKLADVPGRVIAKLGANMYPAQSPLCDPSAMRDAMDIATEAYGDDPLPFPELSDGKSESHTVHPVAQKAWTKERVATFCLAYLNGKLSARSAHERLAAMNVTVARSTLDDLIKQIKAEGRVLVDGQIYGFRREGQAWIMVAQVPEDHTHTLQEEIPATGQEIEQSDEVVA